MAKFNGTNGRVRSGATPIAEINQWDFTDQVNEVTGRAFGEDVEQAAAGARSITGSITGFFDPTDTAGQGALVVGALLPLDLYIDESVGTQYHSIAEALINNIQIGAQNDQYVSFTAAFRANTVPVIETVA